MSGRVAIRVVFPMEVGKSRGCVRHNFYKVIVGKRIWIYNHVIP